MAFIAQLLFIILLIASTALFVKNVGKIRRNINLGKPRNRSDNKPLRWKTMAAVAMGQTKMTKRPVAAFFHFLIYAGFILINVEILEIIVDGIFGTHRVFAPYLGVVYDYMIGFFEILALAVLVACVVFLGRRYLLRIKRFFGVEMVGQPQRDATTILLIEIALMTAFLTLDAADMLLQQRGAPHFFQAGLFPVSQYIAPLLSGLSVDQLLMVERVAWWGHIIGIFAFLNYLPFSKHFHIIMAFPNTWYSNLDPKGKFTNMQSVTNEVKLMLDPSAPVPEAPAEHSVFGVKEVTDLTWKNLMDAYTCTECGRCTSVCPANITGKLLSPRKIVMNTRDRLDEYGKNIDAHGQGHDDGKSLHSYITPEELWACTTCNACTEACPVNIDPLEIIVEMRRYLVMEQSAAPAELNGMFTNMENNGAPWQFPPSERFSWADQLKS
jgi:heterodisulfide reductase subunit C